MKKKLIYIEWCDAIEAPGIWQSKQKALEWAKKDNWIVCECGYLLKETNEYILLANRITLYDRDNPEYAGVMKIPKTWIRHREVLSVSPLT